MRNDWKLCHDLFKTQTAQNIIRDGHGLSLQELILDGTIVDELGMKAKAKEIIDRTAVFDKDMQGLLNPDCNNKFKAALIKLGEGIAAKRDKITQTGKPCF